jgi:hypothetical protein
MSDEWKLKTITRDQLDKLHREQSEHFDWTLSSEREFVENLFCQRFNFMLVLYSLFVAAAASANTQPKLTAILGLGALITTLTSLTIWRAYEKLIINLSMLYRLQKHPLSVVGRENDARPHLKRGFPVNSILGIWVPLICSVSLITGFFLALFGCLSASP